MLALNVGAATVTGLNEALVIVADKTDKTRAKATEAALQQVMIKLTADRKAVASNAEALLKDADSYVLQYQYQELPAAGGGADATVPALWVQFDEVAVKQALAAAGLPLWAAERPSLLVWALSEEDGSASLSGSEDQSAASASLRRHAERRGVPLVLPLLDLDDQGRIHPDDIKQDNIARIKDASARYGAQATATVVLTATPDSRWRGRFTLYRDERSSTWLAQGKTTDDVLSQGMDQLADALAALTLAPAPGASGESVQVLVEGVSSARQYAQVEAYLRTLSNVSNVVVKRLEPGRVTFAVVSHGGLPAIAEAVAAGQVLQPIGAAGEGRFRLLQ